MILSKGYTVKHGTRLGLINSILKNGLIPNYEKGRGNFRIEKEENPVTNGIYVGKNLSYYGALLAFTSFMKSNMEENKKMGDLPIVLEIELGKDCQLLADEDYIKNREAIPPKKLFNTLTEKAKLIWNTYQSGSIVDCKIPIEWIKNIEFPILQNIDMLENNKKYQQDLMLLVLAYWQYKTNATVKEFSRMIIEFKKANPFSWKFTNVLELSEASIKKIFNIEIVKDKEKYYNYSLFLWKDFTKQISKLGLDYHN